MLPEFEKIAFEKATQIYDNEPHDRIHSRKFVKAALKEARRILGNSL